MPRAERSFNVAFGLSAISWAILGLSVGNPGEPTGVVRIVIASLNLIIGSLFLFRSSVAAHGSPGQILVSVPSLLVAGWAITVARPLHTWPVHAVAIFTVGALVAATAFLTLGRSFAILPALRARIVTRGPFRLLRHPAYAGELVMVTACGIAVWSWWAFAPALIALPLVAARILAEERVLAGSPDYADYRSAVRWRLIPGIW